MIKLKKNERDRKKIKKKQKGPNATACIVKKDYLLLFKLLILLLLKLFQKNTFKFTF